MGTLPDQFLFVNKFAVSGSLSHSSPEEGFFIHSHVQSKWHKQRRQNRQRSLLSKSHPPSDRKTPLSTSEAPTTTGGPENSEGSTAANSVSKQKRPKKAIPDVQENSRCRLGSSATRNMIDAVAIDPFYCMSTALDAKDQRLLFFPFTSFSETTFSAESLLWTPSSILFRHREAVAERLRRCVDDELTMNSTLAYSASCMRWSIGEKERERPPEFYILKAIEALKNRLNNAAVVDTWLVLSIYSLACAEMWAQNYGAATAHLQMTHHLVDQLGGLTSLDAYLMESILLCNKYVAIGRFKAPVFPLDWEPELLPEQEVRETQVEVDPSLLELAQGFFDLDKHVIGSKLLQIVDDICVCTRVSEQKGAQGNIDASDQHWLFLRHQAVCCRLLSLQMSSETQECCRVALIVWQLKVTGYFGAQRWSKRLLPDLRRAIVRVDNTEEWCPSTLMFWMASVGAMAAEYTGQRDWFLKRTVQAARSLGIKIDKEPFRCVLRKFLFLQIEDGLQFIRMIRAARELQEGAW